ncbi:hypothetical protein SCNRRL3882_7849 [Streptomyces chartreusis NRRL 3882]|uniref:Uncharacterized protein n=1 Tax=Streptomyces chartreusis NRRL 3882 TaxID=1079985 RepID=A0A2N9BM19_STRCX|nr:hypothetical protein SCNRRL3882_7849 [Streptomyces chartreusis NRRL 3882]
MARMTKESSSCLGIASCCAAAPSSPCRPTEMQVRLGPAKGKDSATTLGPVFVTPDELEPYLY